MTTDPRPEQIRQIATKVMGWFALYSDEPEYGGDLRFHEPQSSGGHVYKFSIAEWNPFTNPAHTEMLMDRMLELGWQRESHSAVHEICDFYRAGDSEELRQSRRAFAADWRTAVCLAALGAMNADPNSAS